jgi:glycosyltransferase involved in cell wall biosynthesis
MPHTRLTSLSSPRLPSGDILPSHFRRFDSDLRQERRGTVTDPDERAGSNTLRCVRALIVTHMWPSPARPEHGVFVRDQVEALRLEPGMEVEVRSFPPGALNYVRAAWRLRGSARRGGFDVVHAHYGLSGWSALTARARRTVVTFHGTDLRHAVVGPMSRLLARRVTLPATASASLARRGLPSAGRRRVAVLPCGVDMDRFRPLDRARARTTLGLEPQRPLLLFPSDPHRPVKRFDRAEALAARAQEAKLIALHGVDPKEVPLWINAANAVVIPSDDEGFGLAALEGLACNVPVLATPVGIAPLALAGVDGALCAPYEADEWADALRPLLGSDDPRVEGRSRAELFSSKRMAARVAFAYRELMEA